MRLPTVRRWITKNFTFLFVCFGFFFKGNKKEGFQGQCNHFGLRDAKPFPPKSSLRYAHLYLLKVWLVTCKDIGFCAKGPDQHAASPEWMGRAGALIAPPD